MRTKMEEKDGKRKTGRMEKSQRREERNSAEGRRAEEEKCSAVIVETYKKRISSFFPSSTSLHCPHTQQHILCCTLLNVSQSRGQLAVLSRFVLSPLSESTVCVFFFRAQTADQEADIRRLSTPSECLKKHISASDGCQPIQRLGRADTEVCEHTEVQPNARPEG